MLDRFILIEDKVLDKSNEKELTLDEAVKLLNQLQDRNIEYRSCIERIKEGLISLDVAIGELSWLVDDRRDNDIHEIREKSLDLSYLITKIMYPQTEDNNDWWY